MAIGLRVVVLSATSQLVATASRPAPWSRFAATPVLRGDHGQVAELERGTMLSGPPRLPFAIPAARTPHRKGPRRTCKIIKPPADVIGTRAGPQILEWNCRSAEQAGIATDCGIVLSGQISDDTVLGCQPTENLAHVSHRSSLAVVGIR
jgi:hypothetical protein